jgi:transposase
MDSQQRHFTREFKLEAVRLLQTSGKSGVQLAKDLGISDSVLYRWR